jgi:hypothetical protein
MSQLNVHSINSLLQNNEKISFNKWLLILKKKFSFRVFEDSGIIELAIL